MVALFKSLKLDAGFVVQSWESMVMLLGLGLHLCLEGDAVRILRVIAKVAVCIPAAGMSIAETLLEMLHTFQVEPAMAGAILQALKSVCYAKVPKGFPDVFAVDQWASRAVHSAAAGVHSTANRGH